MPAEQARAAEGASLPKEERIAKRRDFLRAYDSGVKHFNRFTVLFLVSNEYGHPRIGVTTTKKVGKAHLRNRMKRWIREVYRTNRARLGMNGKSIDVVVNVKASAATATFADFSTDLVRGLERALNQFDRTPRTREAS